MGGLDVSGCEKRSVLINHTRHASFNRCRHPKGGQGGGETGGGTVSRAVWRLENCAPAIVFCETHRNTSQMLSRGRSSRVVAMVSVWVEWGEGLLGRSARGREKKRREEREATEKRKKNTLASFFPPRLSTHTQGEHTPRVPPHAPAPSHALPQHAECDDRAHGARGKLRLVGGVCGRERTHPPARPPATPYHPPLSLPRDRKKRVLASVAGGRLGGWSRGRRTLRAGPVCRVPRSPPPSLRLPALPPPPAPSLTGAADRELATCPVWGAVGGEEWRQGQRRARSAEREQTHPRAAGVSFFLFPSRLPHPVFPPRRLG